MSATSYIRTCYRYKVHPPIVFSGSPLAKYDVEVTRFHVSPGCTVVGTLAFGDIWWYLFTWVKVKAIRETSSGTEREAGRRPETLSGT
jgi:hypothetical protein